MLKDFAKLEHTKEIIMSKTNVLEEFLGKLYPKSYAKEASDTLYKEFDVVYYEADTPKIEKREYSREYSEFE